MKLARLNIAGFRSLKQVEWHPGDLNVIIGPNGSGKSNLLRFLELISVAAKDGLGRHIQSLGGMSPLVWDGQAKDISFALETSPIENYYPKNVYTYAATLERRGKTSAYQINNETLDSRYLDSPGNPNEHIQYLERDGLVVKVYNKSDTNDMQVLPYESVTEDETLLSQVGGLFLNNPWIKGFQDYLKNWTIYHDMNFGRNALLRQDVGVRSEKQVDPDGQNLISVLHTLYEGDDRNFKRDIDDAMQAAFGPDFDGLSFAPVADGRIQLRVRWKTLSRAQSAADLSDGTLRFLFLLTVLANPSLPTLIAIDEPETGLHPSMLPIVAEYAVEASRHTQVILTTHSDQFLDAFSETKPTTTIVKWANGETTLNNIDEEELAYWLKNYTLGDLQRSGELEQMA